MNKNMILKEKENLTKIIEYELLSYKWGELWKRLEIIDKTTLSNDEKNLSKAAKAMLLAAWWQDHPSAKELIKEVNLDQKKEIILFIYCYTSMAIGDLDALRVIYPYYKKKGNQNLLDWLEVEWLGRSKQYKKQIQYIRNINKKRKITAQIKIGLLQSLDHDGVKTSELNKYIKAKKINLSKNELDIALTIKVTHTTKAFKIGEYYKYIDNGVILYQLAKHEFSKKNIKKSVELFDLLIEKKFINTASIIALLTISISMSGDNKNNLIRIRNAIKASPKTPLINGVLSAYESIIYWCDADWDRLGRSLRSNKSLLTITVQDLYEPSKIFTQLIVNLYNYVIINQKKYRDDTIKKPIYIIGESHSLSGANAIIKLDQLYRGNSQFIMGIKMYHLSNKDSSYHWNCMVERISSLPINANILVTIGEIDTRPNEGIWKNSYLKQKSINNNIKHTVDGYIDHIKKEMLNKNFNSITIQGVPAPGYEFEGDFDPQNEVEFLKMIKSVNERLKRKALGANFNFLDVYGATVGKDDKSNGKWHLDDVHISPLFYQEADKWLIKPVLN